MAPAAVLAAAVLLTGPAAGEGDAAAVHREAASKLAPHQDGLGFLDEDAEAPALLRADWKTLQAWAADWLDRHGTGDLDRMTADAAALGPGAEASAVRLDDDSVLVEAREDRRGTAFILSRVTGRWAMVWTVEEAEILAGLKDGAGLLAWRAEQARARCRDPGGQDGRACGPLAADLGVLPKTASGLRRFYLAAAYGRAGEPGPRQFSVWSWDGAVARPLLVVPYRASASQEGPKLQDGRVVIPAATALKQAVACGGCAGRELRLTVRLPAKGGAVLAGRASTTPELDLVDEAYDRALRGRPLGSLAGPAAARRLRAEVRSLGPAPVLGAVERWRVRRSGARRVLCLATDRAAHDYVFGGRPGALKLLAVRDAAPGRCFGPGSRP